MQKVITKEELLAKYHQLPSLEKRILQLKTIFFDIEYRKNFFSYISDVNLKNPNGAHLQHNQFNQILQQFADSGFINKDFSIVVNKTIFHNILQDALQGENAALNLTAIERAPGYRTEPLFKYNNDMPDVRAVCIAIYTNKAKIFTTAPQDVDAMRYFAILLKVLRFYLPATTVEPALIADLDPAIQLCFCLSRLSPKILARGICSNDFADWLTFYKTHELPWVNDVLAYTKIQTDLCLGRLTIDYKQLAHFPDKMHYAYTIQGSQSFLAKDLDQALVYYKTGLKLEKSRLKKKLCFLNDVHGLFFLLIIVSKNMLMEATEIIQTIEKVYENTAELFFVGVKAIISLQHGESKVAQQILDLAVNEVNKNSVDLPKDKVGLVSMAILAYAQYLIDASKLEGNLLSYCQAQFQFNPAYALATHINAEILFARTKAPIYAAYLSQSAFGEFRLLDLIKVKPEWENVLTRLNNILVPATANPQHQDSVIESKRLAWLLDPERLRLEAVEQKKKANGAWSKGKPVALKRLYHRDLALAYLTEQDWAAVSGLQVERHRWSNHESFSWSVLATVAALVGNPNVCHMENRDIPLELVKGEPELNIEEVKDGYRFSLSHYAEVPTVIVEKETQNRYKVINYTDQIVAISSVLPKKGLIVPVDAKEQVLSLIQQTSSNTIHINTNAGDLEIPTMPGDLTCCLHMFPIGAGFKINVGIRPFGEQGPFYRAGHGLAAIIATLVTEDGQEIRKRALRDLKAEKRSVTKFIKSCQTLLDQDTGEDQWRFEELETCLEVLTEIEAYTPINVEWPQGQSLYVKQTISAQDVVLKITGNQNWFEYDGEIKLNNSKALSMEMLLNLLDGNTVGRFVKLNDGQFLALTNKFKKKLEELKAISEGNKVFHLGTSLLEGLSQEVKNLAVDNSWQEHLAKIKAMQGHQPKVPSTLQAVLRDYQQEGFKYLSRLSHWGIGACLADDMGLGKTVQTIALLLEQAAKGPTLVIAPTSVCFNWVDELAKFAPTLNINTLANNNTRESCIKKLKARDVLICSYGLLQQVGDKLIEKEWRTIVLDEAQAIKNPQTKRWQYAAKLKGHCRIALTGTPIENHLGELWSIFRYLNPGLLGSAKLFQERFSYPIEKHNNNAAKSALRQLVHPYILRRLKSEVLSELPAKTEQTIIIEPSEAELAFYEALRKKALERISKLNAVQKNGNRFSILAEITKLRQACCHSSLVDSNINLASSKVKVFMELVAELLENNHKALVFSQYVRYLGKIKETLDAANIKYQYIDGRTPAKDRKAAVERFQAGEGDLFLLSLKAGGTGLNLTAADYVLHLDPWWNPAVEDQASDRAHRIGQLRPVTIYRLITKDSIEEKIIQMHQDKRNLANDLLSGGDLSGKMSEEELIKLIS